MKSVSHRESRSAIAKKMSGMTFCGCQFFSFFLFFHLRLMSGLYEFILVARLWRRVVVRPSKSDDCSSSWSFTTFIFPIDHITIIIAWVEFAKIREEPTERATNSRLPAKLSVIYDWNDLTSRITPEKPIYSPVNSLFVSFLPHRWCTFFTAKNQA